MRTLKKLIVILVLSTLILSSCKKDENSNNGNYRIKEWRVYYDNVPEVIINYFYSGDKLEEIKYFYPDSSMEYARHEFKYFGDSVGVEKYLLFEGIYEQSFFRSYIYEGDRMVRENLYGSYNENWFISTRKDFEYSGDHLVSESSQQYLSGMWSEMSAFVFEYENDLIVRAGFYYSESGWNEMMYEVVEYHENKIKSVTRFVYPDFDINSSSRHEYTYEGNKLVRVDYLDYDNGYIPDGGIDFEYDAQGNLASSTETYNDLVKREEFIYEEGNGNYEQFIIPGYTIFFKLGYPHPSK